MRVGDLSVREIRSRIERGGLPVRTGPVVFSLTSPMPVIAQTVSTLYQHHSIAENSVFVDFYVRVRPVSGVRRLYRPQVVFDLDGLEPFHPLPINQAAALLEWGMNWCVYSHAHFLLVVHGAVLEKNGHALLLPAPSGSGKSTLCAALMLRGWRLLSDELILFEPQTGNVLPICRPVSLKNQSIEVIRNFAPDALMGSPVHDTSKGTVAHVCPTAVSCSLDQVPVLPRWVVFPKYAAGSTLKVTAEEKADVFISLVKNAFNYSVRGRQGFDQLTAAVDRVDGYSASYGDLDSIVGFCDSLAHDAAVPQ